MRRFLLALFTLLIIPATIVLAIAWTTLSTVNNPKLIKHTIVANNSYSKLIAIFPQYIKQQEDDPIVFTRDEKDRIAKAAISEEDAQKNIESIIDSYLNWLNKSTPPITQIDLKTAKENAKTEVVNIYKERYAALPECSSSELLLQKIQQQSNSFPSCRIPPEGKFQSRLNTFDPSVVSTISINNFPDKIELPTPSQWQTVPTVFKQANFFLILLSIADLVLIALSLYMIYSHKKALFRYLGSIFLICGLAVIGIQYFLLGAFQGEVANQLDYSLADNAQLKNILVPIINSLFTSLKDRLNIIGLIATIGGIILLVICLIIRKKPDIEIINEDRPKNPRAKMKKI